MLSKLFTKPVEIKFGEQVLKFHSVVDFEFAMAGRIAVPSKKIAEMVKFSTDQLKKEARTIKDIEKRFVAILSKSIEDTNSINRALRELDPLIFSQDHSWRDIIGALNEGDDELNPYRRIALVKYMQYLSSRQEIIKYLYTEKKALLNEPIGKDTVNSPEFKDTLILENTIFEPAPVNGEDKGNAIERMPKGEAVTIALTPGEEVNVMLSKHHCTLSAKDGIQFTDQDGRTHPLIKGRNIIGRDSVSNIVIESSLRDVSRLHLVIENHGENVLQLTDLSSHGTYIPAKYIAQHSA